MLHASEKGVLSTNLHNAVTILEHDPVLANQIWYDEFLDSIVTIWAGQERKWRDADDVLLQLYLQRHAGMGRVSAQTAHDAAQVAAFHDVRNEARDWLTSLHWDRVPRLNAMLSEAFGAEENHYSEAVGRCWITSIVARVFRPGCKVDTVPVLEGGQGMGKSTALGILGGKWFIECHESVTTKDFYGVLDGHMIVEISEMHSFGKAEVERIKGIISCQIDRYRKSYGRNAEDHPRQSVLCCTTNRDDWQKDDTGARRFWPVLCGKIDLEWLRNNRDQLFAEAVSALNSGASWWDVPDEKQREETEKRRDVDAWESILERWLIGKTQVSMEQIIQDGLQIATSKIEKYHPRRAGSAMRAIGWHNRNVKIDGRQMKMWHRNE